VKKSDVRSGSTVNHDYTWSPFGLLHDSHAETFYTPVSPTGPAATTAITTRTGSAPLAT
jgi:hypothetical protein